MPYVNEHAARLVEPGRFDPDSFRRENDKFGEGIDAIFGKLKGDEKVTLQAIRFDAAKFTAEEARQWLKEHGYEPLAFEEAVEEKAEKGLSYLMPLQKVIEAKHEVWGIAAVEQPDQSGEIMDYQKSKPHFWAWSKRVQKASGGKSYGNVRDSHTSKAVGKVIKLLFDDAAKAVRVGVKIVDSEAWQKVIEGVFTGFSIGGRYGERWNDPLNKGYVRYEAIPTELSMVDLPCIPGATFEMVKADGSRVIYPLSIGDTMKEKIQQLLKQEEGEILDEEKIQEIAEEIAAVLEEQSTASDGESDSANEAQSEETPENGEEEAAEEQPKALTVEDVREIVLSILAEFGLVEQAGGKMQLSAKVRELAKAENEAIRKALDDLKKQFAGDIARLAVEVETLSKRGGSGPVLRELGVLTPQTNAALQKAEVLKSALSSVTDPLAEQALRNEIARLEIQAIQTK